MNLYLGADIVSQIQKGVAGARGDDTKGVKSAVIDWVTPRGENLNPPLHRRQKVDRGFNHHVTGGLLCPAHLKWEDEETRNGLKKGELIVPGHSWPMFLYEGYLYNHQNPWAGLLRSVLLVMAFKHIFIAPGSVDNGDTDMATKGGNAEIHGMKRVTKASIVYVATQVRFALSSATFWSRTDRNTDSENFYVSLLDTLEDPFNAVHAAELLAWWDRKIFPHSRPDAVFVPVFGSPLDRIRQLQTEQAIAAAAEANGGIS
ncbi:hypothetical protein DXG01_014838 [Tephrocybe rancida]|nr:hypothetical protein DXG01_014838 [Tephrocybe rancida]